MNKPHIYKITNQINNKFYYGVHNGSNTEKYMGSGKLLHQAYEKYGIENFSKEILLWFDTIEEAYEYEAIIVNEKKINDPNCYNMKLGGNGGFSKEDARLGGLYVSNFIWNTETRNKGLETQKELKIGFFNDSEEYKQELSERAKIIVENQRKNNGGRFNSDVQSQNGKKGGGSDGLINSENYMNKQKKQCPFCPISCNPGLYARYHGNMCKYNSNSIRFKGDNL